MAHPGGRPRKERLAAKTPAKFAYHLASLGCTNMEIAERLGISHDTLAREPELCESIKSGRAKVQDGLRSLQIRTARKVPVMQIWLGKQLLGQRDKQDVGLSTPDGPVQIGGAFEIRLVKPDAK